jgi:hypothetical protein
VVQEHETDGERDGHPINVPDGAHDEMLASRFGPDMYGADRESLTRAGMASAAGVSKVGCVDRRARIGGRKYVVHTMAGGTVCDGLRTRARCQAVIAVGEPRDAVCGQVVPRVDSFVPVTSAQVTLETRAGLTVDCGSLGPRMTCSPWRSVQTGASVAPRVTA